MYKLVIFDLDGTLADTSEGIYNAHRYTTQAMGIELKKHSLDGVIGGELLKIYQQRFSLDEENARRAVDIYRKWYQENGILQATLYDGMKDTLAFLKEQGYLLAVATLKREDFAKILLENLGVAEYFDWIYGMDREDTLNKEKLIRKCMVSADAVESETVLVGDSANDAKGAEACGVDFVAVTYGFGFTEDDRRKGSDGSWVSKPSELCQNHILQEV